MGVLNVTPDSFSDGGRHLAVDDAVAGAVAMIEQGASVIDVGGESTRPGADPVPVETEVRRVVPVIEAIVDRCRAAGVRVSIDTRHEGTAIEAIRAGADLVNDVSASLWEVAADAGVGWVAMHMQGAPGTMQRSPHYDDVVAEVRSFLDGRAMEAERAGVAEVWVDPGIGFGKTVAHNVALLARLDELVADGRPVVIGTSRKRSLGVLLARSDAGLAAHPGPSGPPSGDFEVFEGRSIEPVPVDDRIEGSLATATWAMIWGASMVRSHDVATTVQAAALVSGATVG
ncbi:MAG: dihydropteroate synthase [Acidimicrobiales bacterium]